MKKHFLFTAMVMYCAMGNIAYGQTLISINGSSSTVVRFINDQSQYEYAMDTGTYNDNIGLHENSYYGLINTYRSQYSFDVSSIPSYGIITSAKLQYTLTDWPVTNYFAVCELSQNYAFQALWNAIGTSPLLFSYLSYNGGETASTQDLIEAVNSARNSGTLYLGCASQSETSNQSYAKLSLTLKVTYITNISLVVDNNFTDNSGNGTHGTMVIDGTTRTIPSAGYAFTKNIGQNLSLSAVSPQTDNQGYQGVWHTGSSYLSEWTRNGEFRSYNQTHSLTVTAEDAGKTYLANLRQIRVTTSGALSSNETWFTNVTLTGDVTVPTGKTLTITSDATVNLFNGGNRFSIISTGGTITNNGTINDLRARLTANLDLRGLCGSIQTAATYANSTNEILLENGNFNENVSINSKYSLSIFGSSDYNHFGNLTVSSCDAFQGVGFGAKSVFINNASYLILASINAYGTNQSTIGFSLYNSDTYNVNNLTAEYSQTGILCSDGTEADIEQSFLYDNLNGLRSFNGSNISINNSYFCGTGLDLQTYNFSSIEAGNCYYDGGTPSTSGSNIYHYGNQNCPLSKVNSNQQTENSDYVTVTNEDKPGGPEFDRINSAYFALNKKLTNAFKEKTNFNKEAFRIDYEKVIEDFKEFIRNNPDSPLAKIALIASAKSYRRIDDIRGKNDFAGMKIFLTDIIENKEYSSLKSQAERLMIDYYRLTKDFTGALKTADKLIENYKEVPDYVCGVLYAKGLILAYDLNQPDKAAESFSYILQQYRKNSLASLAENELRILGKEIGEQISGEAEIVGNEIELNNYPNPFNPTTTISYSLPEAGNVQIKIFDVLGREVAKLVDETKNAGKHTIIWNGSNNAAGIYFYTITFQNQTLFKKMLMIK